MFSEAPQSSVRTSQAPKVLEIQLLDNSREYKHKCTYIYIYTDTKNIYRYVYNMSVEIYIYVHKYNTNRVKGISELRSLLLFGQTQRFPNDSLLAPSSQTQVSC